MWSPNRVVPAFCLLLIICAATEVIGIIGGRYARLGMFPHHAALLVHNWPYAGGSLVSEFFVLTCAHCVTVYDKNDCTVLLGVIDIKDTNGQKIRPLEFIPHPQYNETSLDYDIGLIRLSRPAITDKKVQIIGMAPGTAIYLKDMVAIVTGFGNIDPYKNRQDCLKYAYVPLWGRDRCNARHFQGITTHGMICAADEDGRHNPCKGDSGGGLVVNHTLMAVLFMDYGCGKPHLPFVYQYVPYHRQWIDQVMDSFWNNTMNAHNVRHKNRF